MDKEFIEKPVLRALKELDENNGVSVSEIVSYVMSDYADHRKSTKLAVTKIVNRILLRSKRKGLITSIRGYYRLCTQTNKEKPLCIHKATITGSCPVCGKRARKRGAKKTRSKKSRSGKGTIRKRSLSSRRIRSTRSRSYKRRSLRRRH